MADIFHHEDEKDILKRIDGQLEKIANDQAANLPAIEIDLNLIARSLAEIANFLRPTVATKLTLSYSLGGFIMGVPVTGTVGQVYDPIVTESNSTTPSIQPIGPLAYASDNTAVATVDPSTGIVTLVAAGTANVSVIDQGNGLTNSVTFTVTGATPPVATALDLEYQLAASQKRNKK